MEKFSQKHFLKFVNFTKLREPDLLEILRSRNSYDIRQTMVNQEIISEEDHLAFCDSLKMRNDCLYFQVLLDGNFIGVIDFQKINYNDHTYNPGGYCILKGQTDSIWSFVCSASTYICIEKELYFPEICVRKDNSKALIFNIMKQGCKVVSEDNDYYYLTSDWLDPKIRSKVQALSELSYLNDLFLLEFDL